MPFMWADTLLAAERAHVMRLFLWSASSVLIGTALIAWLRAGRRRSALLEQFAIQTSAWGAIELVLAFVAFRGLALRDLASATRLDRFLWLNVGLDLGYVLVGVTLIVIGWRTLRRPGLIGAGFGASIQGFALATLDLVLASHISR